MMVPGLEASRRSSGLAWALRDGRCLHVDGGTPPAERGSEQGEHGPTEVVAVASPK